MSLFTSALAGVNDGANFDTSRVDPVDHQTRRFRHDELTETAMSPRRGSKLGKILQQCDGGQNALAHARCASGTFGSDEGDRGIEVALGPISLKNVHQLVVVRKARTTSSCGGIASPESRRASISAHCPALSKSSPASSRRKSICAANASCSAGDKARSRAMVASRLAMAGIYHSGSAWATSLAGAEI